MVGEMQAVKPLQADTVMLLRQGQSNLDSWDSDSDGGKETKGSNTAVKRLCAQLSASLSTTLNPRGYWPVNSIALGPVYDASKKVERYNYYYEVSV